MKVTAQIPLARRLVQTKAPTTQSPPCAAVALSVENNMSGTSGART